MNTIQRVFKLMEQAGINQSALAKNIGASKGLFTQLKQGKQNPSSGLIIKLARFFNVSTDYLLGLTEIPNAYGIEDAYKQTNDEKDLLSNYRQLTPNSKQIVLSLAQLELNHIIAFNKGETSIKIVSNSRFKELDKITTQHLENNKEKGVLLKVYNQSAAAGSGSHLFDNGEDDYEMVRVSSIPNGVEFGIRISGDSMEPKIHNGDIAFVKRQPAIDLGEIGIFIYDGDAFCKQLAYKDNNYYLRSANSKYKDIPLFGDSVYCVGKVVGSDKEY